MQQPVTVQCSYCWSSMAIWIAIDDLGEMIHDCEVCCRPLKMFVWIDDEGVIRAQVSQT